MKTDQPTSISLPDMIHTGTYILDCLRQSHILFMFRRTSKLAASTCINPCSLGRPLQYRGFMSVDVGNITHTIFQFNMADPLYKSLLYHCKLCQN